MFVNADSGDYRGGTIPCEKGHQYEFIEFRDKKLLTVLGSVTVKRAYYNVGAGIVRKTALWTSREHHTVPGYAG
jgi:hypothetical protein